MRLTLIGPVTALVYVLHQDFWFWRSARPLVFGFLPIGLFYHAVYTVAISLFMWYVVRHAWPSHLEGASESTGGSGGAKPAANNVANERPRVSHARRAGHGVPASTRAGGSGGAKPPG